MNSRMNSLRNLLCMVLLLSVPEPGGAQHVQDLSGEWRFRMDPSDAGVQEQWYFLSPPETVRLPGSMVENGKGDPVTPRTPWAGGIVDRSWFSDDRYARYRQPGNVKVPFWLTPRLVYQGAAWYQRDVAIPPSWAGRRILLFFERCHWETRVWVDSSEAGLRNSLAVPHEYDLTKWLVPGRHRISVRVDNRIKEIDVGQNAHSVTDHTQTNWNGIIGRMELQATSPVFLQDVRVYPDVAAQSFNIAAQLRNATGRPQTGTVTFRADVLGEAAAVEGHRITVATAVAAETLTVVQRYALGNGAPRWDEFHPNVYKVSVRWEGSDARSADERHVNTGLREFRAEGTRFAVNGRPVFLRGTLDWVLFPLTGYPSMREEEWERIFSVIRAHGLNHVRFHSWCPPEAAFNVADRQGVYLQIECGAWCRVGDGGPIDRWLYEESERIVAAYGNHPSFCMMAYGNEPDGPKANQYLAAFVSYWKQRDRRRVYTSGAGWPTLPENDYVSTMYPRIQVWGMGLASIINREPPQTMFDFRDSVGVHARPVVAHETGQWCVYPDFREIPRYAGVLRAGNLEIFRDDLQAKGMGHLAVDFLQASGRLQALCYKADIEAALRTPGMAGFQLLGLHDFQGQGTALVGIVNVFSQAKGYISPTEFRRFCSPTVPLARMSKLIFTTDETFTADIEVAHSGEKPMTGVVPVWTLTDMRGRLIASGQCDRQEIPLGNAIRLGRAEVNLRDVPAPDQFRFTVRLGEWENSWEIWVYPESLPSVNLADLLITQVLDEKAVERLQEGGRVLLTLKKGSVRPDRGGSIALGFSSIFWNTAWTSGQPPHTLGILCDPAHPVFAAFPTEAHSDYQWWDAVTHGQAMIIDSLPGIEPLIRVIDDWFQNRPLALAFEARVGNGSLLVCSVDLLTDPGKRPAARQLLHSLASYAAGPHFHPKTSLNLAQLRAQLHD